MKRNDRIGRRRAFSSDSHNRSRDYRSGIGSRESAARANLLCGTASTRKEKELTQRSQRWEHRGHGETEWHGRLALRKGEDEEATLAGDDDGEEAAVGRNGEIAEGKAVKDRRRDGLRDRDVLAGSVGAERRQFDPDEVAGLFLDGALEKDARFVG